jgi:hypothetical protein
MTEDGPDNGDEPAEGTGSAEGDESAAPDDPGEDSQETPWPSVAYNGILFVAFGFGLIAVAVGVGGLFLVLTGGTNGDGGSDVPGEFECESFEGDPAVGHEVPYVVDSTVRSAGAIETFNGSVNESSVEIELQVTGELLNAFARTADGTNISVTQANNTVRVTRAERSPFRLWVDRLSQNVVRTQLDICPPASPPEARPDTAGRVSVRHTSTVSDGL